jgi:hypothetical protein
VTPVEISPFTNKKCVSDNGSLDFQLSNLRSVSNISLPSHLIIVHDLSSLRFFLLSLSLIPITLTPTLTNTTPSQARTVPNLKPNRDPPSLSLSLASTSTSTSEKAFNFGKVGKMINQNDGFGLGCRVGGQEFEFGLRFGFGSGFGFGFRSEFAFEFW